MSQPSAHHLSDEALEQLTDGLLGAEEQRDAETHLASCGRCAAELEGFRSLFAAISDLPRFAPSPAFGDGVMSRVRVAPAPGPAMAWLQRWLPSTRRGWTLLVAAATVPVLPVAALVAWVLTHPVMSPVSLWQWTSMQSRGAVQALMGTLLDRGMEVGVVGGARAAYAAVLALPPGMVMIVVGALAVAIPLSAWSLVRLVRTPMGSVSYAN